MRIVMKNVIAAARVLTAGYAFFIFLIVGVIVNAEPRTLLIGGLLVWVIGYILGLVIANVLQQIEKETELHPIKEKKNHHRELGVLLDIQQGAELPRMK